MISDAIRAAVASSMAATSAVKAGARQAIQQAAAKKAGSGSKPTSATAPGSKPTSVPAPGGPEVPPFMDSAALLAMGDRSASRETENADRAAAYARQAAEAVRGTQEAELSRVSGAEHAKNAAAARGLQRSSIRDASLDAVDSEAARKVAALQSDLALTATSNDEARARGERSDADFMAAIYQRAAENAAAVPRDPRTGAPTAATTSSARGSRPATSGSTAKPPKKTPTKPPRRPQLIAGPKTLVSAQAPLVVGPKTQVSNPPLRGRLPLPTVAQQALAQRRARNVPGAATLRRG